MTEIKKKRVPVIRIAVFCLILLALVIPTQYLLQYRERQYDNSSFQIINFYKEEKNSLDAVFIGSSCVFSYYSPLLAYNSYGVKTANYASSGMSLIAYKYAIEEVLKTQENALIVVTYTPQENMSYSYVHYMADYMPLSMNKINFLRAYAGREGGGILDTVEWLVPMLRYHSRWNEIEIDDFVIDDGTKGATAHEYYLSFVTDITDEYAPSDKRTEMPEEDLLIDLLDYLDKKEARVLFLMPPRGYYEEEVTRTNTAYDIITSRGYDVLDMRNRFEDMNLNVSSDYYDKRHTNIHGSIKYTDFVMNYLMSNYDILTDQKDTSFDSAYKKYLEKIESYTLDVELNMKNRDFSLGSPDLEISRSEQGITISWNSVDNADGYVVYCKNGKGSWERIAETKELSYDCPAGETELSFTVISFRLKDGMKLYGNYDYLGKRMES